MNNWQAYYDFEKKKESDKEELNKKRLIFLGAFALTLVVVSLLLAVFSSAAMAKLLFGSLFALSFSLFIDSHYSSSLTSGESS